MRVIPALAAALLAAALASQAWAKADWVSVERSDDNGGYTAYIDTNSIHRTGAVVRSWQRFDYVNGPDGVKQLKGLSEDNCATGQTRVLQATAYYADGRDRTNSTPGAWEYVTPDTVGKTIQEFVCGK